MWSDVDFEGSDFYCFVDNKLKEEFIDTLKMRPRGLDLLFLFDTGFGESKLISLEVWKRPEDILFDHGHNVVKEWNDQAHNSLLILK